MGGHFLKRQTNKLYIIQSAPQQNCWGTDCAGKLRMKEIILLVSHLQIRSDRFPGPPERIRGKGQYIKLHIAPHTQFYIAA